MDNKKQEHQPLLGNQEQATKGSWKVKASIVGAAVLVVAVTVTIATSLSGSQSPQDSSSSLKQNKPETVLQRQSKHTGPDEKYAGYKVLSVNIKNGKQKHLREIIADLSLDVWDDSSQGKGKVTVGVPMATIARTEEVLQTANLEWDTEIEDVNKIIDQELKAMADTLESADPTGFQYNSYNTYKQMEAELRRLTNHCPDGFRCEVFTIGQTYENNDLTVLHISKEASFNKAIWMDSLIHCREWITGATLMNIIKRLIYNYGVEETATKLMDNYEWYFLPVMNPDGYIYTWTTDRLWRQNRQPNAGSECVGTDLNRNYEYMWGGVGASTDPCNNEYRGDSPASAPETQHMQRIIKELGGNLLAWINLHSCAQKWLIPWAFTEAEHPGKCDYPQDYPDLFAVADKATKALDKTNHQNFTAGNWCQSMYASSGVLQDHAKAIGGVKYAYTLELRAGDSCFVVDPKEIIPSANEVYNGIVAMVDAIKEIEEGYLNAC